MSWWREAVLYQVYVRSFADSDGDGIGDLAGLRSRLDYLEWLGVDGLWLNPIMPSPNADWGYDVADYTDVDSDYGTLADLDALVSEAGARAIRVLLDLVPNHSSDRHPWFVESRSSRKSPLRDWYVWADPKPDGSPPNNWASSFGGPAWTLDERTSQYYLHNFLPQQPDLNWWNDGVRDAFDDILRFWLDRGVAGFRIDVANAIVKDRELRDNPPAGPNDHAWERRHGQRRVYNANRPEVHEVFRRWRRIADGYQPERILVGEAWVHDPAEWARYYGAGDELHLAFDFLLLDAPFEAAALSAAVDLTEAALPAGAAAAITGSNHDVVRFPTRWCGNDEARVRCALLALLTLRGTPVLYYGDELGMPQATIPPAAVRDVVGRDGARTPMQWAGDRGAGFTEPSAQPWLPFGNPELCNGADQRRDPDSTLSFTRELIALRRELADLRSGSYAALPSASGTWAWIRGDETVVAINLSDGETLVEGVAGTVRLSTGPGREGEPVTGTLRLGPRQGALVSNGVPIPRSRDTPITHSSD